MKSLASITDKEIEIIKMALNDSISDMNTELKQELSPEKKNELINFKARYTRVFDKLKQSGSIYALTETDLDVVAGGLVGRRPGPSFWYSSVSSSTGSVTCRRWRSIAASDALRSQAACRRLVSSPSGEQCGQVKPPKRVGSGGWFGNAPASMPVTMRSSTVANSSSTPDVRG